MTIASVSARRIAASGAASLNDGAPVLTDAQLRPECGQIGGFRVSAQSFVGAFAGLAFVGPQIVLLAVCFGVAGLGIAFGETAEPAVVATHATVDLRGSAFGALATIQSLGNCASSGIVFQARIIRA